MILSFYTNDIELKKFTAKLWKLKRGRGRPRKNSMNSNLSNTQNSYLEEGIKLN